MNFKNIIQSLQEKENRKSSRLRGKKSIKGDYYVLKSLNNMLKNISIEKDKLSDEKTKIMFDLMLKRLRNDINFDPKEN